MAAPESLCDPESQNAKAFLKLLRWLENYPRDDDAVYMRTYGGSTFADMKKHPNLRKTK